MNPEATPKKVLNFFDIVLMTVTANFGIRWLAVAGGIGPSSIIFWIIGALSFFIPLSFICAQMSKIYPEEGGLYAWVKHTLGEKSSFMVAWLYWVNNIFYYPAILIFLVSNFAYFIGHPELAQNTSYITSMVLVAFWASILMSIFGLKTSKYLINLGGILGLILPAFLLIVFAVFAFIKFGGSATKFNIVAFAPGHKIMDNLSSLAIIMFAMAGVEVIPTFANSVKNIKRDLYAGLLVGALIILALYICGTFAMNVLATPDQIAKASGLIQVFSIIDIKFDIPWFTRIISFLLSFAELAAIIVWLIAPVIMFFKCTPRGILPDIMHKTDKNGTPVNALIFQGVLVSIIIIITGLLPSVNSMYQVLVLMATILYFIPYLFLVIAYIKSANRLEESRFGTNLLGIVVFISIMFGIMVSFVPSADLKTTHEIIVYEVELISGPLFFILAGWFLYRLSPLRNSRDKRNA